MITKAIKNAFHMVREKGWERMYWAFDIHSTILIPTYSDAGITNEFYPYAKEVLQLISTRKDIVRILYTCSHETELSTYVRFFKDQDIYFDYVNENPEVPDTAYSCYQYKPYFNVLFDDKAGFDPHTDWLEVKELLNNY